MFSFEGNFRSTPTVSLGGKSKKTSSTSSVADVVNKAREERQKRETTRKQIHSSIVLQSSIRSYLVRKRVKEEFRQQFDEEQKDPDLRLFETAKLICFFYEDQLAADAQRLIWLCQRLLKEANNFGCWSSTFLLARVLALCCRNLLRGDAKHSATCLRMLEVCTGEKFWGSNDDDEVVGRLKAGTVFWKTLMQNDFFYTMVHVFEDKVPPEVQYTGSGSPLAPHLVLAQSLVDILLQPLRFAHQLPPPGCNPPEVSNLIVHQFIIDVASKADAPGVGEFIIPSLSHAPHFPKSIFLSLIHSAASGHPSTFPRRIYPNVYLLASLTRLYRDFTDQDADLLLHCVAWLFPMLAPVPMDDDDDSDDDIAMDTDDNDLMNDIAKNSCQFINSDRFIHHCVSRSSPQHVSSICAISCHLNAKLHRTVHTTRFLYNLSFSPLFLKCLWKSLVNLKSGKRNNSLSSIQMLLYGRPMDRPTKEQLISHLVTFTALYSHNLLSLHDTDFYGTDSSSVYYNAFSLNEIVDVVKLLREICLSLLKKIFPEWRSMDYDVREIFQRISSGKSIHSHHVARDNSSITIENAALLFKVCSRLLNQLYTRHTRRAFSDDVTLWLSTSSIEDERTTTLSSNWRRRNQKSDSIAAHMAGPSDEALPMSSSEARQLTTLTCLPFVVPFQTRVSILTSMLSQDRQSRESSRDVLLQDAGLSRSASVIQVKVRRDFIYEDAFNDLSFVNAPDLRRVLRVSFVNAAGADEAGYGEGVTREFFQQLIRTAFDPSRGLFQTTTEADLCPNPNADRAIESPGLHFHFLGRLLGKILYEGMQVELRFAAFFLCKLLRFKNADVDINHLQSLDPDFYKNLMFLRSYDGDVSDLDLNFTVVDDKFGETRVTELIPGGHNVSVTNDNRLRYILLLADYKLNLQTRAACDAFRRGLDSVIPLEWLRMFDSRELQTLISGAEAPIDVDDMRDHAAYSGGYTKESATVRMFWSLLETFSEEEKRKLLFFVTSCSRPPLLGFKEMHPPFCIHNGGPHDRLPTSSTCLNLLRIPQYEDRVTMREKLLYCIDSQAGFELS